MDTGAILGAVSLAVAAIGAYTSLRRANIEDRTGANAQLHALNKTYLEEIERLEKKQDEAEKRHAAQIEDLQKQLDQAQKTIVKQANRITSLERDFNGSK